MSAEIIAKLGLNDEKFARGLAASESKWRAFSHRVSEIRDTKNGGGLLPPLPEVDQKANGILGLLRKKFSGADLFKDTLKGLGVGLGAGAIGGGIAEFFSAAADRARSLAALTADLYQGTLRLIGVMGGPARELELQRRQVRELNRDIEDQRRLVAELNANPINLLTDGGRAAIREAEEGLNTLIKRQADLSGEVHAAVIQENRRTEALQRQQIHATNLANLELRHAVELQKFDERRRFLVEEYNELRKQGALPSTLQANLNEQKRLEQERALFIRNQREKFEDLKRTQRLNDELTKAELRDASEVEKKQIRLNALRREYDVINKRGGGESDLEANRNEQRRLQNEIRIDQRNAQRTLANTLAGVGADLAGRNPNAGPRARPRGRSERERIADRAAQFRLNAEEGARTGKSPEYIARMAHAAAVDLQSVGGKIGASTAKVTRADADALGSPLLKTNQILEDIRKNLAPTKTK